jgi:hypothetical protein
VLQPAAVTALRGASKLVCHTTRCDVALRLAGVLRDVVKHVDVMAIHVFIGGCLVSPPCEEHDT